MSRYLRQEILPQVGLEGQARLGAAHVLVVGAGGLGCPALQYLVAAGVGRVRLVDGDTVAVSNLHRQTLYRENQTGMRKVTAATQNLQALNSDCIISPVASPLTPANVDELLVGVDIVLDCADSFAASYILSDACFAKGLPLISASALGLSGYAAGFCGGGPSLRAVFPDLPARAATCASAGILGPVVGMMGVMQAQMALGQILELSPSPLGQMVTFDLATYRLGGFRFDGAPEPKAEGLAFIAPETIAPGDFVVELRATDEAPVSVTPNALRASVDQFTPDGPRPLPGQRAVLCCRSGLRSWQAARRLQAYWPGEIVLIALGDTPPTT